jgi:GDP-L-fucose synthase
MSKILITGGNGFIGGYLRNSLSQHHQVLAPGRSLLDLTNLHSVNSFFDNNQIDVVVHCALIGRNNINGVDDQLAIGNMNMFTNLYRNRHRFKRLINMGTGNEFDTIFNNNSVQETELFNRMPVSSYAYAKNMIARCIADTENMLNLRLFGVFGNKEVDTRFFKRLKLARDRFHIFQDVQFDFLWVEDLCTIVNHMIDGEWPWRDINCVYREKYMMSELANLFAQVNSIDSSIVAVDAVGNLNFTGHAGRLSSLNLPLQGMTKGFESYV